MRRIAVIGAGWAGLACALQLAQTPAREPRRITLFDAAPEPGGRARTVRWDSLGQRIPIDNGQHILIGAYTGCLDLMQRAGVDPANAFHRLPFGLPTPEGWLMRAPDWPAPLHVAAALASSRLAGSAKWGMARLGMKLLQSVPPGQTVEEWLAPFVGSWVWQELLAPLCVAALNTPPEDACARRFGHVLRRALFSNAAAPGFRASDFLVPKASLSELMPDAALRSLAAAAVDLRMRTPVRELVAPPAAVGGASIQKLLVEGEPFDRVVLATSPASAARLVNRLDIQAAAALEGLRYEPISTVFFRLARPVPALPAPMLALPQGPGIGDAAAPGHWLFDRTHTLDGAQIPMLAVVTSAARASLSVERGAWMDRVEAHLRRALPGLSATIDRTLIIEKRATFACTPAMQAVPARTAHPALRLAGDFTEADLPATLEAAVLSGQAAAAWAAP
ncbi:hydroxysqualene dehydroxylase HpnE [Piscinibacterium candidicorallinum]|uniref:Hydroxysqualene dehydroxylase HpnE n=1 Tax=Piscinibacterium candidicorallinum TaxID=1793872 RepID=A0ABV7H369_9BURK